MKTFFLMLSASTIIGGGLIGGITALVMDKNPTEYQQIVESCEAIGGSMVTALRFDIQKIDKKLVEVQVKAKVCKTPSKEALK